MSSRSDRSFEKYLLPSSPEDSPTTDNNDDEINLFELEAGRTTRTTKKNKKPPTPISTLGPEQLHNKLLEEIREADRYNLINEAKLRALRQGTNSYEEFRQIWKAAHLRPLEKKEVDGFVGGGGKNAKVVWNNSSWAGGGGGESSCTGRKFIQQGGPHLSKEKPRDHGDESQVVSEGDKEAFNVPKSSFELWRSWKKLESLDLKFQYLCCLLEQKNDTTPVLELLEDLWKEEIPYEIFVDLILMASSKLPQFPEVDDPSDSEQTLLLESFRKVFEIAADSKRISITLSFLGPKNKELLERLLQDYFLKKDSPALTKLMECLH